MVDARSIRVTVQIDGCHGSQAFTRHREAPMDAHRLADPEYTLKELTDGVVTHCLLGWKGDEPTRASPPPHVRGCND